jgi:hypothetical protein
MAVITPGPRQRGPERYVKFQLFIGAALLFAMLRQVDQVSLPNEKGAHKARPDQFSS